MKMEQTTENSMIINMRNSATSESADDYHMHFTEHVTMFFLPFRVTSDVSNYSMDCQ
jgi:hypothetical protein